jgi:excisionase family DNA binding protein
MVRHPAVRIVDSPDFLTLQEFAERTGVSLTQTYERAKAGTLEVPVKRIGRQYRISRTAYERFRDEDDSSDSTERI